MKNSEKLNAAIGKILDEVNESLDKKETPNPVKLEALKILAEITSLNYNLELND